MRAEDPEELFMSPLWRLPEMMESRPQKKPILTDRTIGTNL